MKIAFPFILYITINTLFLIFHKIFSLNQLQNEVQICVFIILFAFSIVGYRKTSSHALTDEVSLPILDWYVSSLHYPEMMKNMQIQSNDEFILRPLLCLECKNSEYDHEGYDQACNLDLALCNFDHQCGYEGDDEDDGEYEDEDFNKKIEKYIAARKREWREEMIRESFLCIEAAAKM